MTMVDVRPNRGPGMMNLVMLKTTDNIPNVDVFYRNKLAREEWTKVYDYHNSIYDSTMWEKGDLKCEVRVAQDFSRPNGQRLVQLFYGLKSKRENSW